MTREKELLKNYWEVRNHLRYSVYRISPNLYSFLVSGGFDSIEKIEHPPACEWMKIFIGGVEVVFISDKVANSSDCINLDRGMIAVVATDLRTYLSAREAYKSYVQKATSSKNPKIDFLIGLEELVVKSEGFDKKSIKSLLAFMREVIENPTFKIRGIERQSSELNEDIYLSFKVSLFHSNMTYESDLSGSLELTNDILTFSTDHVTVEEDVVFGIGSLFFVNEIGRLFEKLKSGLELAKEEE